jgi:general secretion pathway protein D
MLNLMFLKYATVDEVAKLLDPFLGEGGKMWSYAPANLLMIQDSRRNMARLLELISLFDNDTFANQRIRLYEIKNGRPSDIAKELESILRSISLNEKVSPVKLLPIDRINTLVAVAANPGVFKDVENWLSKIDIEVEASAGTIGNFVYRVRYGCAPTIAGAIMGLYSNNPYMAMGMMGMAGMSGGAGCGGMAGGMGGGMMGGGMGAMYGGGMGGMMGGGMYGGGMMGGGMMGGGMYGGGMMGGMPGGMYAGNPYGPPVATAAATTTTAAGAAGQNLTGQYLGAGTTSAGGQQSSLRIVPNPFDNTLLIQGTRQDYESILRLLKDIDVPPRQVLVEAKIYEVSLTGDLRFGVQAYLTQRGASLGGEVSRPGTRAAVGTVSAGGVNMSIGALVGASRELLALIQTGELTTKAKVVSAPSVVATDSIPASINIGDEVPTLTAQAVTGAQQGGNSLFANSIQSRNSGTTLNIVARVNPSGIVTLIINQEVSTPVPPDPGAAIQSPSFSKRNVSTQVTLQDGDTIAIGGIINESSSWSRAGVPGLSRVPVLGAAFGGQRQQKGRTELIVFFTPRVIYDMNDMNDATDELKLRLRKLSKDVRNLQ